MVCAASRYDILTLGEGFSDATSALVPRDFLAFSAKIKGRFEVGILPATRCAFFRLKRF